MTRIRESELARLLRQRPETRAPEQLAQRIKAEIPERIVVGAGALRPHPDREHAVAYRQIVLLGVLLVAAVAVALWGLQAMLAGHERDARQAELERLLAAGAATARPAGDGWLDPARRPGATLPVRIDPASFSLARALLDGGRLPASGLVIAASFVDAFDYGDPAPLKGELAIYAEGAVAPDPGAGERRLVRITLRTADAPDQPPAVAPAPIAYAVTARLTIDPETVARYRLADDGGYAPTGAAGAAGEDLLPGHRVTVLVELELVPGVATGARVLTVSASWRRRNGTAATADHTLLAGDVAIAWATAPVSLRLAALSADLANALAARAGPDPASLQRIHREADSLAARHPTDNSLREVARLAARAMALPHK